LYFQQYHLLVPCDAMRRAMIAAAALCLAAGCDNPGEGGKEQAKAPSAAPSAAAAPAGQAFAGAYRSTWGETVFAAQGDKVDATYPGGSLACAVKEGALDCSWKEGNAAGKAHLTRSPSGDIEGTWGNGESDKDGGKWTFTPKK
jgi:hypothetical protein